MEPRKFKVACEGQLATLTLDAAWLARPFMKGVVENMARRCGIKGISDLSAILQSVEIDGTEVADLEAVKAATAADVVPEGAQTVRLRFGAPPPQEIKFKVHSPLNPSFTITLNRKFMQRSFFDAVVVPYVAFHNKRRGEGDQVLDADSLVTFKVDGALPPGDDAPSVARSASALSLLGPHPAHSELFFSPGSVSLSSQLMPPELHCKVYVGTAAEMQQQKEYSWDFKGLHANDGICFARHIQLAAPLGELKRLYLSHNELADAGLEGLARALNLTTTPALKRLFLSHNRISDVGLRSIAKIWSPGVMPQLEMLALDENWITSQGAQVLLEMAESGALIANETRLHGNTGISPDARARMTPAAGSARKCRFDFEPPDTRSPFKTELGGSPVTPMPGGGYLDLNKT